MAEIKKTLAILKVRWPETSLIVGLYLLSKLLDICFRATKHQWPKTFLLLYVIFSLLITTIWMILYSGFLRTVYLEGQKQQSPLVLFRVGKHFFGRMLGLGLLGCFIVLILAWLIFLVTKQFTSIETGLWETAKIHPWLYSMCVILSDLLLIKFLLFLFPLIIVMDCRIFESFKFLKYCKLLHTKKLVALVLISYLFWFLWTFLPIDYTVATIPHYILRLVPSVVLMLVWLLITTAAVGFVGSLDLEVR